MIRNVLAVFCCLTLMSACNRETPQEETLSQQAPGEWIELFNGENLDGWRSYGKATPNPAWIVEDGAIVLDADESTTSMTGGDLITNGQYESFELELEWKISSGGNSGIFFGVREIDGQNVAYETGVEMQVLDDDNHADGEQAITRAGACYALYAGSENIVRPVGQYNEVRLVVRGAYVEHWLNGRKIVEYEIGSDDWANRVAASKFADWEHFARYRKGHIALQDHTDRVWYRNIRLREL